MAGRVPSSVPHPVDAHVGARVRLIRKRAGLSQSGLGAAVGVSFQQIQKYERGASRIAASTLYRLAAALQVPVMAFFDGMATGDVAAAPVPHANAEMVAFRRAFCAIRDRKRRRACAALIRAVSR